MSDAFVPGPASAPPADAFQQQMLTVLQSLERRLEALEARSGGPAADAPPARAPGTPKTASRLRVAARLPTVDAALAAVGVEQRSLPTLPTGVSQLTVPMAAPADRQAEVELAVRALEVQQQLLHEHEQGGSPDPDGDPLDDPEPAALVAAARPLPLPGLPAKDALRLVMPHDDPRQSLLFEAVAAPAPPPPKVPSHPVWGPRWVPAVAALADFGSPIRDIQSRGNHRNAEEAAILFSALGHLRDRNVEALSELLARRALGLWHVDRGELPWEAVTSATSMPGLVKEPAFVAVPQEALQSLQRRLAVTAAIQKSAPVAGAGKRKNRRRQQRGHGGGSGAPPSGGSAPAAGSKPVAQGGNGGGGRAATASSDRHGQ